MTGSASAEALLFMTAVSLVAANALGSTIHTFSVLID